MKLTRRQLINTASLAGIGTIALSFQNCQNASFNTPSLDDGSIVNPSSTPTPSPTPASCNRPASIFDAPAGAPVAAAQVATINGKAVNPANAQHDLNSVFYIVPFHDHAIGAQRNQHLLTVDVGGNPAGGMYNQLSSNNTMNVDLITDIYVFREDTGVMLLWKQLSASDLRPAAMFLLDPAWVTAGLKLRVVCNSIQSGYFYEMVDLAQAPVAYSSAVPAFNAAVRFGGSSLHRPYVSINASGGQNMVGATGIQHAPNFISVTNTQVQVVLGENSALRPKHPAIGDDHYMAGGMLYDQNGNILALASEITRAAAANHLLTFSGLDLAGRNVRDLRVVVYDTANGMLQGFRRV